MGLERNFFHDLALNLIACLVLLTGFTCDLESSTRIALLIGMVALLLRRDVVVSHSPALTKKALTRLWGTV